MSLPDGVVTFLFTDVEGSTRLWEDAPDVMMRALEQHDEVIDAAVEAHSGVSVKPRGEGDSRFIVFPAASDAVEAVAEMQLGLGAVEWVTPRPVRVRMSLHTGHADLQLGDYYGPAVNRAARLRAIAHGGQVVMSAATWQLVQDRLPAGVTATDMGRHGLKDLSRPEHVYQLEIEGLSSEFPPLKSLDAVPNNLPEQLTDFIGRDTELDEISRLLGQTRLLTILAPGGTGKTRLAIQAAADHTSEFTDGAFFISLADIAIGSDIVQAVATAVGIALGSEKDPQTQLLEYLTPRKLLLIFDNFEHLADAAGIVTDILRTAPDVAVIATSRARLNLTGETTLTLAGLDTSWDTPDAALHTGGVQLFVDAAQRARPSFSVHDDDYAPLARILELTGGMPLAILLAAAWTNMLSVSDIADEIEKNLDFLESAAGDVPDRHRSVRAVFDYTWELLTEHEQAAFAALSVFRGGFTRKAAQAVAGAGLRDLAKLTANSLVTPDPDSGRYRVHELLRQYAQAELERDPARDLSVRDAHAEYYADLCDDLFTNRFDNQPVMFEIMETEFDNIRLAWRHSVVEGRGTSIRRLLGPLWYLTESRSWYVAALDLYATAVDGLDNGSDEDTAIAWAGAVAGHSACSAILGRQLEQAAEAAHEALDQLRGIADPPTLLVALNQSGVCLFALRRFEEAVAELDEGVALAEAGDDSVWPNLRVLGPAWVNARGFVALQAGDLAMASRTLEASGRVFESIRESFVLSWNLAQRGLLALAEGRPDDAIGFFQRSVENSRLVGFDRGLEFAASLLADALAAHGDFGGAEQGLVEALGAADRTSMVPEMLKGLRKIASIWAATNRGVGAVQLLSTVIAEPASHMQQWTEEAPTSELAGSEFEQLESQLEPEEFERAKAAGASKPFRVAVKELIDAGRTST